MRDVNGDAAQPGMAITDMGFNGGSDTFDLFSDEELQNLGLREADSGVYYTSDHVEDVLNGAAIYFYDNDSVTVNGLPVNGWEAGQAELSHIELQNSLMSHQNWRNWNTFMEAELAVLQDFGFDIDRRDWFGYSVYNSDITFVNTNPYYARNEDGTGWIDGVANDNPWGVGLHIYGRRNDITQAADILTQGDYALGIRVDGSNNTLRIAPNVQVRSDGDYGYALAVTYGKNHHEVHQGTLAAGGAYGVGAMFSFGDNELGDVNEQRGSFIYLTSGYNGTMDNLYSSSIGLDGALVSSFDVSGTLSGSLAAIYIDDSALVSHINILNGASLSGDIVSLWNPMADRVQFYSGAIESDHPDETIVTAAQDETKEMVDEMVTHLTFGRAINEEGVAQAEVDRNFYLKYTGNIYGESAGEQTQVVTAAMTMTVADGELVFNGTANILSVTVDEGATLSGQGQYNLANLKDLLQEHTDGIFDKSEIDEVVLGSYATFVNNGTLSPGDGIGVMEINGAFEMGDSARLLLQFADDGTTTDRLLINTQNSSEDLRISTANKTFLDFDGRVDLVPVAGYYSGTLSVDFSKAVVVDGKGQSLTNVGLTDVSGLSPTLSMSGTFDAEHNILTLTTDRKNNAYSQYASNLNAQRVALAFDKYAGSARGKMQDLVSALDFSNPNGSDLNTAFERLSPDVFARAGRAALSAQRLVTGAVLEQATSLTAPCADSTGRSLYIRPLGGYSKDDASGVRSNYGGLIAGVNILRSLGEAELTLGTHAAVLARKDTFEGTAGSKTESQSFYLGAHARYDFVALADTYAFGMAQLAVENADMSRQVRFASFADNASSDWTGWGGSLAAGLGQTYRLSSSLRAGSVFWLDYSFMHQPSVTEESQHGAALYVQSETYRSLRSSLGVKLSAQFEGQET